jgi:hypothetical protein
VFSRYLRDKGRLVGQFSDGADPPDIVLTVDGVVYAVEVTRLMEHKTLRHSSKKQRVVSRSGQDATFQRWMRRVQEEATEACILVGQYLVWLDGDFASFRADSCPISKALDYIRETQLLEQAKPATIWKVEPASLRIQKVDSAGSDVVGVIWATEWFEDARQTAAAILRSAIFQKARKVAFVPAPVVLLLQNSYLFADPKAYLDAFPSIGNGPFCGVYLIERDTCTPLLEAAPW